MTEISIFDTYRAKDFDVFFQQEAELDSKVDVSYVKYGREDIQSYVDDVAKPDIADYTSEKKSSINDYVADKLDAISDYADAEQQEMVDGISSQVSGIVDNLNQQLESLDTAVTALTEQVGTIVTTEDAQRITGGKVLDAYTYTSNLPDMPEPTKQQVYSPYFDKENIIPALASAGSTTYGLCSHIDFIKDGATEGEYFRYGRIGGYQKVTASRANGESNTTVTFAEPIMRMSLYKDETTASSIEVGFDGNANPVVNIPTPPSSAADTQAVTAAWTNGKYADKSLSNINATGKATAAKLICPSSTTQTLVVGGTGAEYIAPATGWFRVRVNNITGVQGNINFSLSCNGVVYTAYRYHSSTSITGSLNTSIPVAKGEKMTISYMLTGASYTADLFFIKAIGEV